MIEKTDYERLAGRNREIKGITLERVVRSINSRAKNYLGRFNIIRNIIAIGPGLKETIHSELFPEVVPLNATKQVREMGIFQGLKLPGHLLNELREFALSNPIYGNRNPHYGFRLQELEQAQEAVGKQFSLASYFNTYENCETVRKIANDSVIRAIARSYLGPWAKHLGCNMWWSFPVVENREAQAEYAQMFHYDLDDYRFIKFFFYLTDVDEQSGPHVFVKKSHRQKPFSFLFPMRRLADEQVRSFYPESDILTLTGKAGDGFAEDTFGIHKGAVPGKTPRLIFQLYFGISQGFTDDRCSPETLKML